MARGVCIVLSKKTAWIFLIDGFEEVEAITPIDYLRRAGVELQVVGLQTLEVCGSHKVRLLCDCLLSDLVDGANVLPDALVLPGGPGAASIVSVPRACDVIMRMHEQQRVIAAICAAPVVVLAKLGLLTGRAFTCFMGMEKSITDAKFLPRALVEDGHIITSRAAGSSAEFSEAIIHRLQGSLAARELAEKTWQYWVRDV
jgi:4-methyl-5(b-hydroxyethyl)-thiazole monophosphate biosynthesis